MGKDTFTHEGEVYAVEWAIDSSVFPPPGFVEVGGFEAEAILGAWLARKASQRSGAPSLRGTRLSDSSFRLYRRRSFEGRLPRTITTNLRDPSRDDAPPFASGDLEQAPRVAVALASTTEVACPGHVFSIDAVGTPRDGTYAWSVEGADVAFVDESGTPALPLGPRANLRWFQPSHEIGALLPQIATITVTYSHPNGTATATRNIKVHGVSFETSNLEAKPNPLEVREMPTGVDIGGEDQKVPAMSMNPTITLRIASDCPRKSECARAYRVGFLQTVLSNDRRAEYTHSVRVTDIPVPIRDQLNGTDMAPFYSHAWPFSADNEELTLKHSDTPGTGAAWEDLRPEAPPPPPGSHNRLLRRILFSNSFHVWIAVQNTEVAEHDPGASFVFVENYAWSFSLDVDVDVGKPIKSRCTVPDAEVKVGEIGVGAGDLRPNLDPAYPGIAKQLLWTPPVKGSP